MRLLAGALTALAVICSACGDDDPIAPQVLEDAAAPDASVELDAAVDDGGAATDAAAGDDAGVPCSVGGVPGECIDVALCAGDRAPTPGHCPGPAEIQCCTPRDGAACDPEAHPLPNEGLVEEAGEGGCPAGMVRIDGTFCIDRFEASLEGWSPYWNPGGEPPRAASLRGAVPQAYVSGSEAAAACEAADKRLCTDEEWLRACQGPDETTFPYGDERQPGVCNDARARHPAVEYFGTSDAWIWSELGHPCIDQLPDSLDPTGANEGCVTAEGVFDMMGNLHEWTSDPEGTFRGGFYVDTELNGPGCLYRTTAHDTAHWDYSTGFRCCL